MFQDMFLQTSNYTTPVQRALIPQSNYRTYDTELNKAMRQINQIRLITNFVIIRRSEVRKVRRVCLIVI